MLHLALLLAASIPDPIGVMSITNGQVEVVQPAQGVFRRAQAGLLLGANDAIQTGENAWAEIMLTQNLTLRLAASSELKVHRDFLFLGNGRVWIQSMSASNTSNHELRVWGGKLAIKPGSTIIAERIDGRGVNVTVIRGLATVNMKNSAYRSQSVLQGQSYWLRPSVLGLNPQKSSRAIWKILKQESRRVLGDRLGIEAYLLDWVQTVKTNIRPPSASWEMPKMETYIRGELGSQFDALLESAIRPAPFSENEVPPKGPNVRVEVSFEGS